MHGPTNLQYYRPWSVLLHHKNAEQFVRNRTKSFGNGTPYFRNALYILASFSPDWCLRTMIAIVSAAVNQFDIHCSFLMTSGSVLMSIQLNFWGVNKNWCWASKLIALKNIRKFFSHAQILLKIIWKLDVADLLVRTSRWV